MRVFTQRTTKWTKYLATSAKCTLWNNCRNKYNKHILFNLREGFILGAIRLPPKSSEVSWALLVEGILEVEIGELYSSKRDISSPFTCGTISLAYEAPYKGFQIML